MTVQTHKVRRWVLSASVVLVLLLSTIALVILQDTQPPRHSGSSNGTHSRDINNIRITRPGYADIAILRDQDTWRISEPCPLAVNLPRLDPLLMLANPSAHRYAAGEVDLEAAGLTSPLASLYFNDSRVDIGQTDLSGERRYIKRGDSVEFAPEWVYSLVSGGLSALSQPAVFPDVVETITLMTEGNPSSRIKGFVPDWQSLEAQQIITPPLPDATKALASWKLEASSAGNPVSRMMLYRFPSYAAFVPENSRCAFLLPAETLPEAVRNF